MVDIKEDKESVRKRTLFCILSTVLILLIGFIYYLLLQWDIGLVCPFKHFIGIDCPFCGLSRFCLALLRFDIVGAFYYHPVIFISMPVWVYLYYKICRRYVKTGVFIPTEKENEFVLLFLLVIFVFFIFRVVMNGSVGSVF